MSERLTPDAAEEMAAELKAKGEALIKEGRGMVEESYVLAEYARGLRRLQSASQGGKKERMVSAERLRVSKGKSKDDPLQAAVNASGYTLRSLAEKLKAEGFRVSHPYLRQCRQGTSAIRKTLAERIEVLTGFKANKTHWPKGWAKEPNE